MKESGHALNAGWYAEVGDCLKISIQDTEEDTRERLAVMVKDVTGW